MVSPGFIDIHTHYDAQVFWDPDLTPSSFHGVTTVIAGNCGFSIAPIRPDGVALLARTLQHVEDMSFDTLSVGVPWDEFETFPQYLDAVARRGTALNSAATSGTPPCGSTSWARKRTSAPPPPRRSAACRRWWPRPWPAGPPGSPPAPRRRTTATADGRCPPAWPTWPSCAPCSNPSSECGRGVVALLPGGVFSNEEVFALQREIGRPFTWTALLTVKGYPYHEKVIAEHDAAWADGVQVWPQVSCRPLVFQMNLSEPFTLNMRPTFAALMGKSRTSGWPRTATRPGGPRPGTTSAARRAASRSTGPPSRWPSRVATPTWPTGRCWSLAEERGCTPLDVMLDVSLDDDLQARFWSVLANDDPEGIAWLLPRDNVLLGLADSGAHVSQLCDACFSTDLLGNWVRERGVMPLERAIHKLTGEPAGVYGLADRGTIEVGQAADLCVFDPETVAPGPLRRHPRLPGRRRAPDGRRTGRHDPHPGQRRAHPGGRGGLGGGPGGAPRDACCAARGRSGDVAPEGRVVADRQGHEAPRSMTRPPCHQSRQVSCRVLRAAESAGDVAGQCAAGSRWAASSGRSGRWPGPGRPGFPRG